MFDMIVKATPKRPKELGLLIVVGGPGRSGCSTISKMLATHFKLKRFYGGGIMREYAKEKGMEIEEFVKYIQEEGLGKEYDDKVDKFLLRQAYQKDVLIESKTFAAIAPNFRIPTTVRIWLHAPVDVRAMRAFLKEKRSVDRDSTEFRDEVKRLNRRYDLDSVRFKESYGIDYSNPKLYNDIVIDSSRLNEVDTLNLILKMIRGGKYIESE